MEEIWKDVVGYEGYYRVSNLGRVKSVPRKTVTNIVRDKILSDFDNGHGYRYITFSIKQKRKNYYIHRLVANAFISNIENKPSINHIDSNRSNNNVSNLEWVTVKENVAHCKENGRAKYNWHPVLQFTLDGNFIKEYASTVEAAKHIGCTSELIQMAANKNNSLKTAKGFIWKYKKYLI